MGIKSELESLDIGEQVGYEGLTKKESGGANPLSTHTCDSAAFPAESVKIEDGHSSCNGVDAPYLLPTDACRSLINVTTSMKTEAYEEEEKWDAILHTKFEVKDEELFQSCEIDKMSEMRDSSSGITSSNEFDTISSKDFLGPLTSVKPDTIEMTHGSADILHMNSNINGEVTFQPYENEDIMCKRIDIEKDLGYNSHDAPAHDPMTSTEVKEKNIIDKHFNCGHCSATLARKTNLINHMRIHTGEKPFNCSHCPDSFTRKSYLNSHMRTHTGEKLPFKCSHCYAFFAHKSNLASHITIHTGEKPINCSICSASFAHKSNLIKHIRTHTSVKPFKCKHCSASFSDKISLTNHMLSHTVKKPFNCSHCSESFDYKSPFTIHMRTHTCEKPFRCSQCPASYALKNSLTKHMRTHSEERRFSFSHISGSFVRKSTLTTHVLTQHRR